MGASAIKCAGIIDLATLEAMACRETLTLALDLSLTDVLVVSDCQGVVNDIHHGTGRLHVGIVKEIANTSR